jgi:hypothetical protein
MPEAPGVWCKYTNILPLRQIVGLFLYDVCVVSQSIINQQIVTRSFPMSFQYAIFQPAKDRLLPCVLPHFTQQKAVSWKAA